MLRFATFICLVTCASAAAPRELLPQPRPRLDQRIVGGEAVEIEDFPYQLSLEFFFMHSCGASVISPNWAITAAHCTDGSFAFMLRVRAGSASRSGGSTHAVRRFTEHPGFDFWTIDNDVAVLEVSTPFTYSAAVQPIPLARSTPAPGTVVVVSGWGARRENAILLPSKLQAVEVPVVDRQECSLAYEQYGGVSESMLCAGLPDGGKDACQGDSGGPVVADGQLVGLVSWGVGCARAGYPGVNADVAVLSDWVLETTGI